MAHNILKKIYLDIYNAPRQSNRTLDEKIKLYRQKLGRGSEVQKRGIVIVDPVNLIPIKAVPSKKTEGNYKLFNKLADSVPKAEYLNLFKVTTVKKIKVPKAKKELKPKEIKPKEIKPKDMVAKPCPPGTERNPKTGRCKKIVIIKKK